MSTRTFRQSRKKEDEVDVVQQKFPDAFSFEKTTALSTAAALWIMETRIAQGEDSKMLAPPLAMDKEIISKIHGHLRKFKEGSDVNAVVERRTFLQSAFAHLDLTSYEIAQVFSLQPQSLDEARVLIPSFERYESEEQLEILNEFIMEATKPF